LSFVETSFFRLGFGLDRQARGDAVQEARERFGFADGCGLASEDEESGLEHVFGVVSIAQHAATYAVDQWAMPRHQFGEGVLIASSNEALQQPPIIRGYTIGLQEVMKVT
jgi:hypothetical protein